MKLNKTRRLRALPIIAIAALTGGPAAADIVTDWNIKACDIAVEAKLGPAVGNRVMAMTHLAIYEAVNAITGRYPAGTLQPAATPGASIEAAVDAAGRATLSQLAPTQQGLIDAAYRATLAGVAESPAKAAGVAVGEKAAAAVLAGRSDDAIGGAESWRPNTAAGVYVPTTIPVALQWPQRKPWLMTSPAQFRPAAPPALASALWARDYNEIKAYGARTGSRRSPEQTEIARFWEATMPPIYHGIVRSVSDQAGREPTQNARLFAAVTQAMDDALIAVFDAKYHYNFWRPLTAIRNGDRDGNDATERDPAWLPFIETPMHPEYPCAHCTVAGAVGSVLLAELGGAAAPPLSTSSSTAQGAVRRWSKVEDFIQEVSLARIYDGVHYRNSTEVGTALGRQVGELVAAKYLRAK